LGVDENGDPTGAASRFDTDTVVYSLVDMEGVIYGDEVNWVFEGPGGIVNEASVALEYQGEVYAYAFVDLSEWGTEELKGDWRVTVYLNGIEGSTGSFSVEGEKDSPSRCLCGCPSWGLQPLSSSHNCSASTESPCASEKPVLRKRGMVR
jgi:hypothetical protein